MKATVTQAFNAYDNTKDTMDLVVVRKVDPATKDCLLQKVVQVVALAQKETHVQRIVEPSGASRDGKEDHSHQIICTNSLSGTNARR
jgi:hypothetical protein